MKVSEIYSIPKGMDLESVSTYLSSVLGEHSIAVDPIGKGIAGIYQGQEKIGTLEHYPMGIRIRSSDESFYELIVREIKKASEDTDGFRWSAQYGSGNTGSREVAKELTKRSGGGFNYIINPIELLSQGFDEPYDTLSRLPKRDKNKIPVMFTRESQQSQ